MNWEMHNNENTEHVSVSSQIYWIISHLNHMYFLLSLSLSLLHMILRIFIVFL